MSSAELLAQLEEEALIVRHSGEIPEVILHGSLHYLTADPEGPRLVLREAERHILYDAAEERFREIILRDIHAPNRDLSLYRGVARTIANWHRYQTFCRRIGRDGSSFRHQVSHCLTDFLCHEYRDVVSGVRASSINCDLAELQEFLQLLGVASSALPPDWHIICDSDHQKENPWK